MKFISDYIGMKNWDDNERCWVAVICRIAKTKKGNQIHIFDTEKAPTQVEIDDWIKETIRTKPWERQ